MGLQKRKRWDSNPRGKVQLPYLLSREALSTSQPRFLIGTLVSVAESRILIPLLLFLFVSQRAVAEIVPNFFKLLTVRAKQDGEYPSSHSELLLILLHH